MLWLSRASGACPSPLFQTASSSVSWSMTWHFPQNIKKLYTLEIFSRSQLIYLFIFGLPTYLAYSGVTLCILAPAHCFLLQLLQCYLS